MAIFVELFTGQMNMATLSMQLKKLREQRAITQKRLAHLIGVTPRVYNRWETGDATPHWDSAVKIADVMEISLDDLAGRNEENDSTVIHNLQLHALYKKVDTLSDEDQQALVILLDSLMTRSNIQKLAQESQQLRR